MARILPKNFPTAQITDLVCTDYSVFTRVDCRNYDREDSHIIHFCIQKFMYCDVTSRLNNGPLDGVSSVLLDCRVTRVVNNHSISIACTNNYTYIQPMVVD